MQFLKLLLIRLSFQAEFRDLTHFNPMFHFYTPWKRQKIFGFLTFSGGIELKHWAKMG